MLGWFRALLPKEDQFFDLFEQHAQTLVAAALALQGLLQDGASVPSPHARRSCAEEHKADRSPARCCWPFAAPSSPHSTAATSRI